VVLDRVICEDQIMARNGRTVQEHELRGTGSIVALDLLL
jgi:hypothetical protein